MVEERDGWRIKKNKNSPLIYKKIKKKNVMLESMLIMIGRILSNSQNRFKNRTLTQKKIQDLWSFLIG